MLVLSRKVGQAIQIGDEVIVRVIELRGDKIRIGIEAPRSVSIVRDDAINPLPAPPECVLPTRGN